MADQQTCGKCGRPVYCVAAVDLVGRQTSDLTWRHWDGAANEDHAADPWARLLPDADADDLTDDDIERSWISSGMTDDDIGAVMEDAPLDD